MFREYKNDNHLIIHGDAVDVLKTLPARSVDLIFVDPPYNIGKRFGEFYDKWPSEESYLEWSYLWLDECARILKDSGSMYLMASTQAMPFFDLYLRDRLTILSRVMWCYDSSGVQAKRYFGSMYEPILFCVKNRNQYVFNSESIKIEAKTGAQRKLIDYRKSVPTPYSTSKVPGNVWCYPRVRYRMEEYEPHPSQKPEIMLERIILASSNEGDVVLDPFAGTFTVGAVARRLERKSISIELMEEYIKIGLRRVLGKTESGGKFLLKQEKSYKRRTSRRFEECRLF